LKPIFNLPRLLIEILAAMVAAEMAIMLVLRKIAGDVDGIAWGFVDAAVLAMVVAPIVYWRTRSAVDGTDAALDLWRDWHSAKLAAVAVLSIGLLLTAWVTVWRQQALTVQANERFDRLTSHIDNDVLGRFRSVLGGLEVVRGLFLASQRVDRSEFRTIVKSLDSASALPGVRQFGFIEAVDRSELTAFVDAQRADDAPDFHLQGVESEAEPLVVKFVEPLGTNRFALGLDLGSLPAVRQAFDQALATGGPVLSGQVRLDDRDRAASGFLFILPVKRESSASVPDADGPSSRLRGAVYALISPPEFMAGVVHNLDAHVDVVLLDSDESPLFDADGHLLQRPGDGYPPLSVVSRFVETRDFSIGEHPLKLQVSSGAGYESGTDDSSPVMLAVAGTLLSMLMALTVWLLGAGRARAVAMAEAITHDLERAKEQAEAALRESQELLSALHQHAIVSITDREAIITDVNDLFCKISGFSREELIGQHHRIVNSGFHDRRFWSGMWRTISSGQPWRGVICNRAKGGRLYWVDSMIAPFRGPDGQVARYVSIRFDITSERLMTEELARHRDHLGELVEAKTLELVAAKEAVETASRAKSAFFASMSHELRTPLHAVLAFAGLGLKKRDTADTAKLADYFAKIHQSGEHMLKLVDDLLTLSQCDTGQMELSFRPCDLRGVAREAAAELEPAFEAKALRFELQADTDDSTLLCDGQRMLQVLRNLLANAVRFSPQGGLIRIVLAKAQMAGRRAEDAAIEALQLEVRDEGPGFPADEIDRVFDDFLQSRAAKSAGGTGLGLQICKRIVEAHRGEIRAVNRREGGASLYLKLPYKLSQKEAPSHG
jgi:PAS domain S-box-containing protein